MTVNTEFLIRQTNMKKFSLELDQKSKQLMMENNLFIKKVTLESEIILKVILL